MRKQIADPVLGTIKIEHELIEKLLNTREFRRLNNISQLGLTSFLYPSATHTRLSHSLGAYELSRRLLERLKEVDEDLKIAIQVSALLHDLGHGPMSHLFEAVHSIMHEEYTLLLIEDDNSEIKKILDEYPKIQEHVVKIIKKEHEKKFAYQIISSQIDVDRLDYLLRDSYFCGTSYGIIDHAWLFKNASIVDDELVFHQKTIQTIENFLLGRYHMYQSVYTHRKNVSIQKVYEVFFKRLLELITPEMSIVNRFPVLKTLKEDKKMSYKEFMSLDDTVFWTLINNASKFKDERLNELAEYLQNGKFPQSETNFDERGEKLRYDFRLYIGKKEEQANVLIDGKLKKIEEVSSLITEPKEKYVYVDIKI